MISHAAKVIACMLAVGLPLAQAVAQSSNPQPVTDGSIKTPKPTRPSASSSKNYFIEFRAAKIGAYGHSYVAYGRLDRRGNPTSTSYADLHPVGNYAVMALGHIVPVPANTEWDPDVLKLPVNYKYRFQLNDDQYKSLLAALEGAKSNTRYWNAVTNNCNHFVGELAKAVGLRVPSEFTLSTGFIPELQQINTGSSPSFIPDAEDTSASMSRIKNE
jgi:hypothetical protein